MLSPRPRRPLSALGPDLLLLRPPGGNLGGGGVFARHPAAISAPAVRAWRAWACPVLRRAHRAAPCAKHCHFAHNCAQPGAGTHAQFRSALPRYAQNADVLRTICGASSWDADQGHGRPAQHAPPSGAAAKPRLAGRPQGQGPRRAMPAALEQMYIIGAQGPGQLWPPRPETYHRAR